MINIKKITVNGIMSIFILTLFTIHYSCDLVDPTEVKNPDITQDNLMDNANGGGVPLVVGLQRQYAQAVGYLIEFEEVTTDNYMNAAVNISQNLDAPTQIMNDDLSLNGTGILSTSPYFHLENLRALADFGLSVILPRDMLATDEQRAQTHFYRGMALLLLSENFTAFPIAENGGPVQAADALRMSITEFGTAYGLTADPVLQANCKMSLARTYRLLGDKTNAAKEANNLLSLSPNYLWSATYDGNNLTNNVSYWVVIRNQNDMQPLPRLDFLDPKITGADSPIPQFKAEEAHLILAEVAIANGDLTGAKTSMKNAITIAKSRATSTFNDKDPRKNRPNDPTYKVKASASAPAIAGLIQKRGGSAGTPVTLYPVSSTSLKTTDIDALTAQTDIVRALYLLRQEIFFLEGRRMNDLGIRWPIAKWQTDANPNYPVGPECFVSVPSYIPPGNQMDAFTTDAASSTITCTWDMNQIIANNYATIKPFK